MVNPVSPSTTGTTLHDMSKTAQQQGQSELQSRKTTSPAMNNLQTDNIKEVDETNLEQEIEDFNDVLRAAKQNLRFKFHKETELLIVELYDLKTDEVIKTLPPEYMLELSVRMKEMIGLFVDKRL